MKESDSLQTMEFKNFLIQIVLGALVGYLFSRYRHRIAQKQYEYEKLRLEKSISDLSARLGLLTTERDTLLQKFEDLDRRNGILERSQAAQQNEIENLQKKLQEARANEEKNLELLETRFENMAQKVIQKSSVQLNERAEQKLGEVLSPFKEKIVELQKRVEENYSHESRERHTLKSEIERIISTHQKMSQETEGLTKALRGDVKAQGHWGEIVLSRILDMAGLREGLEYTVQGKDLGLTSDDGRRLMPDVIVNLPGEKHLIIDSKVSLVNYDRFINSHETLELDLFLKSLAAHCEGLSAKRYQENSKLKSPDFVLLFFPIEGAFSLALQHRPQIFSEAWDKSVIIVSPTTLLATLRTVSSLWRAENQSKNAQEIARQAGLLYDKFVGFVDSLKDVGKSLKSSQDAYEESLAKIFTGKGNLVSRVENLKKLGAKTNKSLGVVEDESPQADFLPS